ncbi:MAG: hypothetical protein WD381_02880, partial [Balneolaceae bacterium]
MTSTATAQTFAHTDSEIQSFIDGLTTQKVDNSYYLALLIGSNKRAKKKFLDDVAKKSGSVTSINLGAVISSDEEESRANIDTLFTNLTKSDKYIYLEDGDAFEGVYTSFSYSTERYATPQERYFIKKVQESEKIIFLDIKDEYAASNTLKRFAQTIITFEEPKSFIDKIFYKMSKVHVHGSDFESKRRVAGSRL